MTAERVLDWLRYLFGLIPSGGVYYESFRHFSLHLFQNFSQDRPLFERLGKILAETEAVLKGLPVGIPKYAQTFVHNLKTAFIE